MSVSEEQDWTGSLERLAEGDPGAWPGGVRHALQKSAPEPTAGLDDRMATLFRESSGAYGDAPGDGRTAKVLRPAFGTRIRKAGPVWLAAASVLVALGAALMVYWPTADTGEIVLLRERGQARVLRGGETLPVQELRIGDSVEVDQDSSIEFSIAGGIQIQFIGPGRAVLRSVSDKMGSGSALQDGDPAADSGRELDLEAGEIFFVSRDPAISRDFAFRTRRATYRLAGTAGLLTVNGDVETLRVVEGAVDLRYHENPDSPVRVTEARWVFAEAPAGRSAGGPEILQSDAHSFEILCRRRDRLLKLARRSERDAPSDSH